MKLSVLTFCLFSVFFAACQPEGQNSLVKDSSDGLANQGFEARAEKAALDLYFANAGTIQGSDPSAVVVLESENSSKATFKVTIDDSNEDGDSWTVKTWVDIQKDTGTVREIRHQTAGTEDSAPPSDSSSWNTLATEVAMHLYLENAGVIQGGDPQASAVELVSSDARFSIYRLSIIDGNDEGESWEVIYTVKMANASPFVVRISERLK